MLKRTYDQIKESAALEELLVATDDERISDFCREEGIPCMMT
ncbi:UNVERIFIED_CONTAM: hypothetical protein GTU68_000857, partial [Idotea baltica]|nr:hypothetical protein [Idotea baltica]